VRAPPPRRRRELEGLDLEGQFALLLTATVRVNPGVAGVTTADAAVREAEYAATLRYLLDEHPRIRKIVLAENSGWPLDRLAQVAADNPQGKEVELLQLRCNDFPGGLGKGYGEALLLDRALAASRLAGTVRHVGKLTGRQRVLNLTKLLERAPGDFELLCDLRDHSLYERLGWASAGRWCDTRFFVFTRPFFDAHLRRLHEQPADGEFNLEAAYYLAVKALEGEPGVVCRFPVEPRYRGRAGHWHKNYGSLRSRAKQSLRAASRFLLPRLRL
jgi:hypothetical protein